MAVKSVILEGIITSIGRKELYNSPYLCKYLKIKAFYVTYFFFKGKNKVISLHENKLFLVWKK